MSKLRESLNNAMTVDGLIFFLEVLKKEDKEIGGYPLVMSKDAEGNSFSPLPKDNGIGWNDWYTPETTYHGDITSDEEKKSGDGYYIEGESVQVVVLWPTN